MGFHEKNPAPDGWQPGFKLVGILKILACAADFVGPNAAGADGNGFVLTAGQYYFAFL